MAVASSGQPRCYGWHAPLGVDSSWNKLPCPYQAYTPIEQCREDRAGIPAQSFPEAWRTLVRQPESPLLKAGL